MITEFSAGFVTLRRFVSPAGKDRKIESSKIGLTFLRAITEK